MIKNNYKIAFVDIDWTILNHKEGHYFDLPSIEALKKLQDSGVLIYFCTARTYASSKLTGLFEIIAPDGMICTNGNVIFIGDTLLEAITIPEKLVKEVLNIANKNDVVLEFATLKDKYFTHAPNEFVSNYLTVYYEGVGKVEENATKNVTEILAFLPEEFDGRFIKELPSEMTYYRYDTYGVNIGYKQSNKGQAIKKVLSYLNIDKKQSLAFGDSLDDISMFEEVGTSIAMGNYKDEAVKEKATIVTDTIDNHGVATIIANLFFKM